MLFTLASMRQDLWTYCNSGVDYSIATADQLAAATALINQVTERIFVEGKFRNTLRRFNVPIYNHHITMPRYIQTPLGIEMVNSDNCSCGPLTIYSRFFEFSTPVSTCCSTGVYPVTEIAQTFITPDPGFKLRVKSITEPVTQKV